MKKRLVRLRTFQIFEIFECLLHIEGWNKFSKGGIRIDLPIPTSRQFVPINRRIASAILQPPFMQGASSSLDSIEGKLPPQGERASLSNRAIVRGDATTPRTTLRLFRTLRSPWIAPSKSESSLNPLSRDLSPPPQSFDRSSALCDKGEPRTDLEFERTLKRTSE